MLPEIPNPSSSATTFGAAIAEPGANPLSAELAEQQELNRRLVAEFASYRRRMHQDAERMGSAQKDSFIHELLPTIDNLERALASGASGSMEFHQGVELTLRQLLQLLHHHGIESQDPIAQHFDPHRHSAVSQRHDSTQADHAILEVLQRGYQKGGKVFRPAKVVVNDGPPGGDE